MLFLFIALGTLGFVGFALLIYAFFTAAEATEDSRGFHPSEPLQTVDSQPVLSHSDLSFFTH